MPTGGPTVNHEPLGNLRGISVNCVPRRGDSAGAYDRFLLITTDHFTNARLTGPVLPKALINGEFHHEVLLVFLICLSK